MPSILPVNLLYASNNGPTAPEAASFEPVDATDMVNLATGDLSYVLPLLNVPSPEGGYPLALSYHAGIALDQEASWVGLGWNVNPGAINRSVVGVPDDWKNGLKSKISFDAGGTTTIENLNMGLGVSDDLSVGLNSTWITNKTVGGERSVDFSIRGSVSYNMQIERTDGSSNVLGTSFSLGNDGFSLGVGSEGQNLLINSTQEGTGISFRSSFKGIPLSGLFSNSDQTKTSGLLSSIPLTDFRIYAFAGPFKAQYSKNKFKYWHFDEKDYLATGSLYSGSFDDVSLDDPLYFYNEFDATESLVSTVESDASFSRNNPAYLAYDGYSADAQGFNGSISPKLLELGRLHTSRNRLSEKSLFSNVNGIEREVGLINGNKYEVPDANHGTLIRSSLFTKSLEDQNTKPHFYIDNEYSSYHKTSITGRSDFLTNQNEVDYLAIMQNLNYTSNTTSDGFNASEQRLKKSSFIETYTNSELLQNSNLIFQIPDLDRNTMPSDGIGAFKVTASDGKTYHYSIPVYQKEKSRVVTKSDKDINLEYMEEQDLEHYATHWLLTAITGPDFIDDGDNIIGDTDLGYWVRFDYGKWSDGFAWRMPSSGYNYTDSAKSYTWGVKDIYYLNSVVTRTHTALFVKKFREDNYSSLISMQDSGNPIYRNSILNGGGSSFTRGTDGLYYWKGAYGRLLPTKDLWKASQAYSTIRSENWFYVNSKAIPTMLLDEIILLENQNVPVGLNQLSLSNGNGDSNNPLNLEIHLEEKNTYHYQSSTNRETYEGPRETYVHNTYRGEYQDNLLDSQDYDFTSLRQNAIKVISFGYNYSLGRDDAISNGRLTLKNVLFKGKEGKAIIPPYRFTYFDETTPPISRSGFDDWGYYSNKPYIWSLKEIQDPLGGTIGIEYESDTFYEKSVNTSYLDNNLQVKFEGTNSGVKHVSVRQDPEIAPEQQLDLSNFFAVGENYDLDIQYYRDPNNNGDNWIADVAGQGLATEVSSSVVKFEIPTNSNKTWVRLKTNCHEQNWVYYQDGEYNHIVDETINWKGEDREWYCDPPGDGSEKIKIRVFFNEDEQNGGGIRTKKITLTDELNNTFETQYLYTKPGTNNILTNVSSGTTSYAPTRKYQKDIPYLDLQPAPSVVYGNVRVINPSNTYTDYKFNVLEEFNLVDSDFNSNILSVTSSQGVSLTAKQSDANRHFQIDEKFFEVENKLSSLGVLISKTEFNNYDQQISVVVNSYLDKVSLQNEYITESYVKEEDVVTDGPDIPVNLSTTNISFLPTVLGQTKAIKEGHSFLTSYDAYDLTTGIATEIVTTDSKDFEIRSKMIPAYHNYPGMGSKVDNPQNANMLTQNALDLKQIKIGPDWRTTAANITTWNNEWEYFNEAGTSKTLETDPSKKIWRKHQDFVWNGSLGDNGVFQDYVGDDDNFVWSLGQNQTNPDWLNVGSTNLYDHYSSPLEIRNVNDDLFATKMGDKDSKVFAIGNAGYEELFYSGAEDLDVTQTYFGGGVQKGSATISSDAHTGSNALAIGTNQDGYQVLVRHVENGTKKYKVSLWAKKGTHQNTRVKIGSNTTISHNAYEEVMAGNWVQLNFYADIADNTTVVVTADGGNTIVDDFRLHPVTASMTSYVYNEWNELSHIIGANNMAVHYLYNPMGRLKQTETEVADFNGDGTGGFKKSREYKYTYKLK